MTLRTLGSATRHPYAASGLGGTGGSRVYVWEEHRACVHLVLPQGVPIHQAVHARPEGRGCIRRCVGVAGCFVYLVLPRGVPMPQAAQAGAEGL